MKKRFTEEQIIGALGKLSSGIKAKDLSRERWVSASRLCILGSENLAAWMFLKPFDFDNWKLRTPDLRGLLPTSLWTTSC